MEKILFCGQKSGKSAGDVVARGVRLCEKSKMVDAGQNELKIWKTRENAAENMGIVGR